MPQLTLKVRDANLRDTFLPGVKIVITGITYTDLGLTDAKGVVIFDNVPRGVYNIRAEDPIGYVGTAQLLNIGTGSQTSYFVLPNANDALQQSAGLTRVDVGILEDPDLLKEMTGLGTIVDQASIRIPYDIGPMLIVQASFKNMTKLTSLFTTRLVNLATLAMDAEANYRVSLNEPGLPYGDRVSYVYPSGWTRTVIQPANPVSWALQLGHYELELGSRIFRVDDQREIHLVEGAPVVMKVVPRGAGSLTVYQPPDFDHRIKSTEGRSTVRLAEGEQAMFRGRPFGSSTFGRFADAEGSTITTENPFITAILGPMTVTLELGTVPEEGTEDISGTIIGGSIEVTEGFPPPDVKVSLLTVSSLGLPVSLGSVDLGPVRKGQTKEWSINVGTLPQREHTILARAELVNQIGSAVVDSPLFVFTPA